MIYYLVTAPYADTMTTYLEGYGRSLESRITVLPYRSATMLRQFSAGTYIFSDLERLNNADVAIAGRLWRELERAVPQVRLLNDPQSVMSRYELLSALHEKGLNLFRACRLRELPHSIRFPVFLRHATDHSGALSGLLRNHHELEEAIRSLGRQGIHQNETLVVEFCDTSDSLGIFRKYSAFVVDDEIVPRHLISSRDWVQKFPDLIDADKLEEERAYLTENPHEDAVALCLSARSG